MPEVLGVQREPSGVLTVNKHAGVTSHDIVNKIRRLYSTKRVGHTGTLDPMATGVLVVLVGRAAKAAEYLVCDTKEYRATLRLGITTDTEDVTGNILSQSENIPSSDEVSRACGEFVGKIKQIPPMYSALKVGGKKLCDLARQGEVIEREAREIEIFSLECIPTENEAEYVIDVKCSSGTYIRTLCADIGARLGCGGAMATLERRSAGGFDIENAVTVEEIEAMGEAERLSLLMPIESLFEDIEAVCLPSFYEKLSRNGCEIYQKKVKTSSATASKVRMCDAAGNFYALGEVREYPEGSAIKAIKLFDI